jgi:aryl-alcohol dehydrogenase-like predicted oxidoreductase
MKRRDFLVNTSLGLGAAWLARQSILNVLADTQLPRNYAASDTVALGKTGIQTSRLAMGTGTVGYAKHSNQTALGVGGLSALLLNGYDHGLSFFDAADSYGSHPHVAAALKQLPRDRVTVMTKSPSRIPQEMRADLDRYRKELGTDYLDIVLLHCVTEGDWTERFKGTMDVLSEAKQKSIIRAHGCSCHSIEALRAAAKSPWVEVDLVRINPIGSHMDADPDTVISVIKQMKASGKGIVGMKILGQGDLRNQQNEALKYALSLNLLDAFTIGAESKYEQDNLIQRVAAA